MSAPESDSGDAPDQTPAAPRLRGLWSVMQPAQPEAKPSENSVADGPVADIAPPSATESAPPPSKSLWDVMASGTVSHSGEGVEITSSETGPDTIRSNTSAVADETPAIVFADTISADPLETISQRSRSAGQPLDLWACLLGVAALPLSALSYGPGMIAALPSAIGAFAALALGMSVWMSARPARASRWRSGLGISFALVSLLAGPLVFAPWGNAMRNRQSVQMTQQHLEIIGRGLLDYHTKHGAFPQGGTHITLPTGKKRGGQGWMTHLLPFVNQAELYQQIQLEQPYDDPVNRPAMGTDVDEFYASGGDRRKVAGGFAVSHFAGVGGIIVSVKGEEVPAGIFNGQRPIRQQEVIDGLANTWIVGEVPGGYAPWGDPENWRVVTKGLNKDPRGFGNAAGTGAMALMADGSVKFFSNQTDLDILKRLSTRDAGDHP